MLCLVNLSYHVLESEYMLTNPDSLLKCGQITFTSKYIPTDCDLFRVTLTRSTTDL